MNADAWNWLEGFIRDYPTVAKVHSILGVRRISNVYPHVMLTGSSGESSLRLRPCRPPHNARKGRHEFRRVRPIHRVG